MKIFFFDTETTGLPKDWKAPMTQLDNWPRIIQLAWILSDANGKELRRHKYLIRPQGWVVPVEKFWIDNGYSTAINELQGLPIKAALDAMLEDLAESKVMVAHNMSYDYNVLGAELIRGEKRNPSDKAPKRICTKESSTNYCKIPGARGYKWPTLTELHTFLFNRGFEGAHDALADVVAMKDCFFELTRRGVITLPPADVA